MMFYWTMLCWMECCGAKEYRRLSGNTNTGHFMYDGGGVDASLNTHSVSMYLDDIWVKTC